MRLTQPDFLSIESKYLSGANKDEEDYSKPIQVRFLSTPLLIHPLSQQLGLTLRAQKGKINKEEERRGGKKGRQQQRHLYLTWELD